MRLRSVRFAAWMPAIRATASASPFGSARRRSAVAGAMRTRPRATARRPGERLVPDVHHADIAGRLVHV